MVSVTAFALGAILTLGSRIAIAATLVQPSGLDTFLSNFMLYISPVSTEWAMMAFVQPFGRLVFKGSVLTYGSSSALIALYLSATMAWLATLLLTWKHSSSLGWADFIAFTIGSLTIPLWSALLPTHTFIHAGFMTRILIVPISLNWAAFFWYLSRRQR
jgi:hypothetical protein